jgi:hypothetical protein
MSRPPPPPRVFVIPAAEAEAAIVFRRGPSNWFHLLKWDMSKDKFESGAWFRGSMYPEKCDISPDGSLLLYFVLKGNKLQTSYSHAWTAVSRAPWLTALGLWPQGTTYGGGGRFVGNRDIVIRAGDTTPHADHPGKGLRVALGNPALHRSTDEVPRATWSGRDRNGRLIFAKDGRIFRRSSTGKDKELIDLAGLMPDPKPSPKRASLPIEAPSRRSRRDI